MCCIVCVRIGACVEGSLYRQILQSPKHLYFHFTAIPCGNLSSPANGQVILDASTFGSQANYSCSEGYILNGNSTRVCQADGQWSGSEPICEGQCTTIIHIMYSLILGL